MIRDVVSVRDKTRIHYRRLGQGPGMVLLHGYPQTGHMWRKVMPALAERFTVVAPDLRGYGDSDRPVAGYDKRSMAADIADVIQGARHPAGRARRPRPGGARRAPLRARPSGVPDAAGAARHRAHVRRVRADRSGERPRALALVLPSASRSPRGPHRRARGDLPPLHVQDLGLQSRRHRGRGGAGVRPLLPPARGDACRLRGLPRRRDDRSRARRRRSRQEGGGPDAGAVGRSRRPPAAGARHARRLEGAVRARRGTRGARFRALHPRGAAGGGRRCDPEIRRAVRHKA